MNARPTLLGIDLGAGSLKATLITPQGDVLGEASAPIATTHPGPGRSEQDPEDGYRALCLAVPQALRDANRHGDAVAAVCVSAGAHTAVLTDADGEVLRPSILWSDQRSAAQARALNERAGDTIVSLSLNRANATWTLPQLLWLKENEPGIIERVERLYLAKDYLRWRMTGDWHSDPSDAVGALMADAAHGDWSTILCDLIGWRRDTLPPLLAPTAIAGEVNAACARATGLGVGTPVVTGSNDTTVELLCAGALAHGDVTVKLATAGVLYKTVDRPTVHPPVSCYPHLLPGMYYTATGTNTCASARHWMSEMLFDDASADTLGETHARLDSLAASVSAGSDGVLFHPYLQGERGPYWDPLLRADFIGLTLGHTRAHLARALYEGIAYSIRDLRESSPDDGIAPKETISLLGGGARSALWRGILADVLGVELKIPAHTDASFGAALVAGIGAGVFASVRDAVDTCVRFTQHVHPDPRRHALYSDMFTVYRDAQRAIAPLSHRLNTICERYRS